MPSRPSSLLPESSRLSRSRTTRRLAGLVAGGVAAGVLTATAPASAATGAAADDLPPGRHVVHYTVRPGDSATELAVRYHAWTAELIAHNHLPGGTLRVGQRIEIPVVLSALSPAERARLTGKGDRSGKPGRSGKHERSEKHEQSGKRKADRDRATARPSRATIRRTIVRTARRHGVDPELALAISWQESGWQMHPVSTARAYGAMQVLRPTAEWMSLYAGRTLRVRDTEDNVLAGVLLMKVLRDQTGSKRHQLGAYYQGLGAVREHGLYAGTRRYVRNVLAIERRLENGHGPA